MADRPHHSIDDETRSKWYRFGVLLWIANIAFIALVIVLLQYDFVVGITFAVVVSILGGIAITVYALHLR